MKKLCMFLFTFVLMFTQVDSMSGNHLKEYDYSEQENYDGKILFSDTSPLTDVEFQ